MTVMAMCSRHAWDGDRRGVRVASSVKRSVKPGPHCIAKPLPSPNPAGPGQGVPQRPRGAGAVQHRGRQTRRLAGGAPCGPARMSRSGNVWRAPCPVLSAVRHPHEDGWVRLDAAPCTGCRTALAWCCKRWKSSVTAARSGHGWTRCRGPPKCCARATCLPTCCRSYAATFVSGAGWRGVVVHAPPAVLSS